MSIQKECAFASDNSVVPQSGVNVRLAYLIGHYPGVSLTFILREVRLLRDMGLDIRTAAVNAAEPSSDGFTDVEKDEQRRTFYVKARGLFRIAFDHLSCALSRPAAYFRGLVFALRVGGLDPRDCLSHFFYFAEAVVVGQWMLRTGLNHVHVHFANNTATVALIATRIFPVKYSVTVHGSTEFYGVEKYRLREKMIGADFVYCIGQYTRSQLMRITPHSEWNKFQVIPLGVDPEIFAPRPFPEHQPLNILCVGRLVPEKGLPILITAFAALVRLGHCIHLHVVGDGPLRASLEEMSASLGIESSVTFHGSMNQHRVRALFAIAGIFVLPSFAEGIPVALMEAMAMEIPCVSTYVGGIPELIDSGQNGILVAASDAESLAQAIETLITDSAFRKSAGLAARARIVDRYNLERNVERLAQMFLTRLG